MSSETEEAYTGRWVARLRGKIIAQGGTPDQARKAALTRFKENPLIEFIPDPALDNFPPLLEKISQVMPKSEKIYLVGGAVRDLLLNRDIHDLDFTLAENGMKTARVVANKLNAYYYPLDEERDTGRVILESDGEKTTLDFASFRGPDLDADLQGRDFTINAIAFDLISHQIFDPLSGITDLQKKELRSCSPKSIDDDPIRILRAIRLAAEYGLKIAVETRTDMKKNASHVWDASPERVRDELFRILEGNKPTTCLRALEMLGVLDYILPEAGDKIGVKQPAPHQKDVWVHAFSLCGHLENLVNQIEVGNTGNTDNLQTNLLTLRIGNIITKIKKHIETDLAGGRTRRGLLFFTALFSYIRKSTLLIYDEERQFPFGMLDDLVTQVAVERARKLALSNDELKILETILRNQKQFLFHASKYLKEGMAPTRQAIYRFFRDSGPTGVELCLLGLANIRASHQETLTTEIWSTAMETASLLLENWFERPTESINPPPLVNGDDIMESCKVSPGPLVGEILDSIREAQATGDIKTRDEAIAFARGEANRYYPSGE